MPLVGLLVGKEKNYLFSDNCQYLGGTTLIRTTPRQFHIQKFKNFVLAYHGENPVFNRFVKRFDLNSFPEPLTKSWLMRHFYMNYLNFLVDEAGAKIENEMIVDSEFGIMIMGKDYCFDIGSEYLYEVLDFNAMGDYKIAFSVQSMFDGKFDDETLIKLIMDKSDKYGYKTSYPFIMVTSDDLNHYRLIEKDGKEDIRELEEVWR